MGPSFRSAFALVHLAAVIVASHLLRGLDSEILMLRNFDSRLIRRAAGTQSAVCVAPHADNALSRARSQACTRPCSLAVTLRHAVSHAHRQPCTMLLVHSQPRISHAHRQICTQADMHSVTCTQSSILVPNNSHSDTISSCPVYLSLSVPTISIPSHSFTPE